MRLALLWTALLTAALPASADIEKGDFCTLRSDLYVTVRTGQGQITLPINRGQKIEVLSVAGAAARVASEEISGKADVLDLEEACARSVRQCKLYDAIEIQEKKSMDGRAWRIKSGATLSILDRTRNWSRVRVGPVTGFTETNILNGACSEVKVVAQKGDDAPKKAGFKAFDLPTPKKGERVILVPWVLAPGVSEEVAVLFEDQFERALEVGRKDLRGHDDDRPSRSARRATLKKHLTALKRPAKSKGIEFLVTGELKKIPTDAMLLTGDDLDEAELDEALEEAPGKYVVILAVFDLRSGKVLKTVRAEPGLTLGSTWAQGAAKTLGAALPSAGRK